jgi:uncharacterized protein (DUF302 family)
MIKKHCPHDVNTTMERLESAIAEAGLVRVARVDHAAAAATVGLTLRPTQLVIFGNPRVGTLLMQAQQTLGLDLPMKMLVWEDADGRAWLGYEAMDDVARRHDLEAGSPVPSKVNQVLADLAQRATAA